MTLNLLIMRGISGSGKSTRAKEYLTALSDTQQKVIIVCRDDLRLALYNKEFGAPINEGFITDVEFNIIETALSKGISVISDNTHLAPKYVHPKIELAKRFDAFPTLVEVSATLTAAQDRNVRRASKGGRFVPTEVINSQYEQYLSHQQEVRSLFDAF